MTESTKATAANRPASLACLAGLALAVGCVGNKERLPATPTQDPFLSGGAVGRPTSTVGPAPRNEHSAVAPDKTETDASTTSRLKTEMAPKKAPSATLMAPAETLSQSNAALAMQSTARPAGGAVQQAQWQSQNPQGGIEQSFSRLQQLGVVEQRLELRGGQWQFTCDAPNPQNPQQRRRYEGADATALGAVKGVLDKLEAAR